MFGAFYPNYFVRHFGTGELKDVHKVLNGRDPMTTVYLSNFPSSQAPYGELYVQDVKKKFELCADPENIHVEFDGSKIIVQFARTGAHEEDRSVDHSTVETGNLRAINENANLTGSIVQYGSPQTSPAFLKYPCYARSLPAQNSRRF